MAGKLLYIFDHVDWKTRMPVARGAQAQGWDVSIGIVGDPPEDQSALDGFDVIFLPRPKDKFGPAATLETILAIRKTIKDVSPDLVHTVTLKYSFLVGYARLGLRGFRIMYTMAGLGFLFRSEGTKSKFVGFMMSPFLRFVLRHKAAEIIFQNQDDRDLLIDRSFVRAYQTHLVLGSGVDTDKFKPAPFEQSDEPLILMPTRLVREKGVSVFIKAARMLHQQGVKARFQIAGGITKHNPRAISEEKMRGMLHESRVEWLGHVSDMPALLKKAYCVAYPSNYGEGVPRVMLEACASAKPIVTTDHPGCRETVEDGVNGFLVPTKNAKAVAEALKKIIEDPALCESMGKASRKRAEDKFAISHIVDQTVALYKAE